MAVSTPPGNLARGVDNRIIAARCGLWEGLDVRERDILAFTGAGGKTTIMLKLAAELASAGRGVIVTTTTRMYPPGPILGEESLLLGEDLKALTSRLVDLLAPGRAVVLARRFSEDCKLIGIPPEWVQELALVKGVDYILVEADGARRQSLTAPRAHEPVIPCSATVVIPVVGLDVLGLPIGFEDVHNPEQVCALTGAAMGQCLSPSLVARVMLGPCGNVRNAPKSARLVPALNKADSIRDMEQARELVRRLLCLGAERVAVCAAVREPPVIEVWTGYAQSG